MSSRDPITLLNDQQLTSLYGATRTKLDAIRVELDRRRHRADIQRVLDCHKCRSNGAICPAHQPRD